MKYLHDVSEDIVDGFIDFANFVNVFVSFPHFFVSFLDFFVSFGNLVANFVPVMANCIRDNYIFLSIFRFPFPFDCGITIYTIRPTWIVENSINTIGAVRYQYYQIVNFAERKITDFQLCLN